MKSLIRNIAFLILISLGFSSCIHDYYPGGDWEGGEISPNKTVLLLNLRALNPSTLTTPAEKIKSVRVIITGYPTSENEGNEGADGTKASTTSIVECNRLIEFPIYDASSFSYTLSWPSNIGKKSVYVIANEESIGDDFSKKLSEYEETGDTGDLATWLESYSFTPEYVTTGGNIFLPYTYSRTDFEPLPGQLNTVNCWLVPVATKFVFYFQNKRSAPVRINGISMAYANLESYAFANIDPDSQYMEYGGESLYWPDWLELVSKSSWEHPEFGDNSGFNLQYGWITDYSVPNPSDHHIFTFVDSSNAFTVPAATEVVTDEGPETVPSSATTDIFYLPESINYLNPSEEETPDAPEETAEGEGESETPQQVYYLTINFEDLGPTNRVPKFENVPIPNLNALFRNTFVVIRMVMGQGDIEIYAEIAPWNIVTSNGWVSEGNNPPANNPFSIRKK